MTINAGHETPVTIQVTTIKMINEINDEIYTHDVYGKLNTTQAKKVSQEIGYTYISKETKKETFSVPTSQLKQLKG